jgi:hypothetical protein
MWAGGMGADTLGGALSIAHPSFGFHSDSRCRLHSRLPPQEDRLRTIDLHYGRAIVPNGSCRRASGGLFGFSAVYPRCRLHSRLPPQEDRLGTIDLHYGRAIVPNGSCRRVSGGFFGFSAVHPRCRANSRLPPLDDRLGIIDLDVGRAIVPNGSGLFRNGLLLKSSRFEIRWILLSDLAQEGG